MTVTACVCLTDLNYSPFRQALRRHFRSKTGIRGKKGGLHVALTWATQPIQTEIMKKILQIIP